MLTRRHIRVKVMQCIYALSQSEGGSLERQEKFLKASVDNTYVLYLLMMSLLKEIHQMAQKHFSHAPKKYLATPTNNFPRQEKFVDNALLVQISDNSLLQSELEKRKLKNWYLHEEYVKILYKEIIGSSLYEDYMMSSTKSYEEDRNLVVNLYREVIAPNDKLYDYFEDDKLTWVDDIPLVNTFILKRFKKIGPSEKTSFFLPRLLKDQEDMTFALQLLSKTLLQEAKLIKEIEGKTPNWDKDRIADIDAILLKMAICELLNFSSIPERVTINEYLEIAKEYSTPKSSIFINGILDKLVKEYKSKGKLKKTGRGLL